MAEAPPPDPPPNIVIVIADDQGWGDLSHHGNTNLETPNIDSLARDGASFRHFFVSAVCSPTRAELLTGRYHPRGGVRGTSAGAERLDLDERTLAETFKHAGYATGAFGRWHNGSQHLYHPNARGENIDWNVGRLLHRLDELGLGDDTLVLYMSDNGPNGWRWNGGMKGRKGTLDEGGVRVPAFVRWPGKIDGGQVVEPIAAAIDLLPTLAELAGVEVVGDRPLDGRSLAPLLVGERAHEAWPDREIASFHRGKVSLRTERFRLDPEGRLFDLQEDPGQRVDITDKQPAEAQRLQRLAEELSAEMAEELGPVDDRPFLIGGDREVWLPARDGRASGGVVRSNRFPNSSYFTDWTSAEGSIVWPVEIAEPGRYRVSADYTCPEDRLGSILELRLGSSLLQAEVDAAHAAPVIGGEHDRLPRQEGYFKRFGRLELGSIELEGSGELTLGATSVPSGWVPDHCRRPTC